MILSPLPFSSFALKSDRPPKKKSSRRKLKSIIDGEESSSGIEEFMPQQESETKSNTKKQEESSSATSNTSEQNEQKTSSSTSSEQTNNSAEDTTEFDNRPVQGPVPVVGYGSTVVPSSSLSSSAARGKVAGFTKSIPTLVSERKDSQIYTMQEYLQLEEARKQKGIKDTVVDSMDHPGWNLLALSFIAAGVAVLIIGMRLRRERLNFDPKMRQVKSIDIEGGVSIGGPWSLVDTEGKRWTDEDFKGKWLWIYFGFTNCPDVCPQEMAKMTRCITQMDKRVGADYWQPLFISIDAKRDTPEVLKEYLKGFHPRLKGLTGTPEEVEKAAREYRVYFAVPEEFDEEQESDYLIDHSIIMYLMDPEGKFCDYTTKEFTWFESHAKLLRRMADYEKKKAEVGKVDTNLKVANIDSTHPDQDAVIGKTERSKTIAEVEREKRAKEGGDKSNPFMVAPDIFDSWKKEDDATKDKKKEGGKRATEVKF